jgi:PPOX class probable F420-dependent enzyme
MGKQALAGASYFSLATFRKSGAEVATPVWFGETDGAYYVFSESSAGKVKRLRNSPRSRVAPCTVTGKVTGDWIDTEAFIIEDEAGVEEALAALRSKYGWQMVITDLLSRLTGKYDKRAYIRVTVSGKDGG